LKQISVQNRKDLNNFIEDLGKRFFSWTWRT